MRRYTMDNGYEFVGVVNLFNIYPEFLFPVYKKNDCFFFHNGKKNRIYNFDKVTDNVKSKIVFLNSTHKKIINKNTTRYFYEHETPVYAFQENECDIICADLVGMIEYLSSFYTEDKILRRQIDRFLIENILEYYITLLVSAFPGEKSFNRYFIQNLTREFNVLSSCNENELIGVNSKNNIFSNLLLNCNSIDMDGNDNNFSLAKMLSIRKAIFEGELNTYLRYRLNKYTRYSMLYELNHEMYHRYYCIARRNKECIIEVDFEKIGRTLDKIIKKISFGSSAYKLCIQCQNAVINKDENELIIILNREQEFFRMLSENGMLDDSFIEYMQCHIY